MASPWPSIPQYHPDAYPFNVRRFGAVGDGEHDDTEAVREAAGRLKEEVTLVYGEQEPNKHIWLGASRGFLYFPPGGIYKLTGSIDLQNVEDLIDHSGGATAASPLLQPSTPHLRAHSST